MTLQICVVETTDIQAILQINDLIGDLPEVERISLVKQVSGASMVDIDHVAVYDKYMADKFGEEEDEESDWNRLDREQRREMPR